MRDIPIEVAAVVQQVVVGGDLTVLVHLRGPLIELRGASHEITGSDHGVGMKCRDDERTVEAVHAPAESDQAVEDVLPVDECLEACRPVSGHSDAH